MVTSSLSERCGAGPGRSKACWILADPFIVSSTMVKMVVRTVALSSIGSTLLVCLCCLQTKAYYSSHFLSATSTKRMSVANLEQARTLYASQKMSVTEIMKRTGFQSRTTFYKYVVNAQK